MIRYERWVGHSVGFAVLAAGLLVTGCGARSGGDGNANSTVNLSSLPAAEAWVDGKAAGSTPLAVPLAPGRHELVFKQTGFSEHRETLDVAAGAVASVDATLQPIDPMDPDAVRLVAAAYGVTVEPFRAPEVHRGAASIGGVSLLFPRNDVRKEGLSGYRVDVTPAYEGGGWLEFRKGKTSLYRQKFDPDTLVNAASLPPAVLDAVKTGDTVTWGVYFTDARKPITAQFEIVAKPTATKKLGELQADRRLALQPLALRQQLEAEVLQNYRLYSEALVRLLDIHAADKDSTVPYGGIVSCLRRLDLEDTALFTEAASKAVGLASRRRGAETAAGMPAKKGPIGAPSSSLTPAPDAGAAAPAAAATPTPAPAPAPDEATASGPTAPMTPPNPLAPGALPVRPDAKPSVNPDDPSAPAKVEPSTTPENSAPVAKPTKNPPATMPSTPPATPPGTAPKTPVAPMAPVAPITPPSRMNPVVPPGKTPTTPPLPTEPPPSVDLPPPGLPASDGPVAPTTPPPAPGVDENPGANPTPPAKPVPPVPGTKPAPVAPQNPPAPPAPPPPAPPAVDPLPEHGPGPAQPEPTPAPAQPDPMPAPVK